jgi:hypothetical protein
MPSESRHIPLAVFEAPDITEPEFAVLVALYSYADSEGRCWPSLASIARRAHLDRSTVKRVLLPLERDGFLSRVRRLEEGRREPTSSFYTLHESRLGRGGARLGRRGVPLPEVGAERARGRGGARPEVFIEVREENPSDSSHRKESGAKRERTPSISSLFPDPSPPSSARPPLPGSSEPAPRKQKGNKVPPELLGPYHEAESRLKAAAEARGITWQYGREGHALTELVMAYAKRPAELGPLVETWIDLTASEVRFLGGKPPTASMLLSLLSQVEAEHVKRKPRPGLTLLRTCPVCGAQLPQGAQSCPSCKTLAEDFGDPEAVASAKLRQGAAV